MDQLKLRLIGRFEASFAGKPINEFKTNKVKALFAYLTAEADQAHTREMLAGMLWPDFPQPAAMKSLRQALAMLRKSIDDPLAEPPYLLITRETVQINRASDLRVDLWDFDKRKTWQPGDGSSPFPIDILKSVIDLYHDPFLDGLNCDSDLFDRWVQIRREGLNRKIREALGHLAFVYAKNGEHESSILTARRLLELEPWDEAAHRLVMEGLARSGQRNAALVQFGTCRQALKKELQVEPEPETQRLYEAILTGRVGWEADSEPARVYPIPAQPPVEKSSQKDLRSGWSPLVGRERELEQISSQLNDPTCRLLTLVGPGGIGKTHLALEAVARQADYFQEGVYFVSLAPLQSVSSIPRAIAQELGFSFYAGGEPAQEIVDYLRKKELLLLLDNFEHLREGASLVTAILESAPKVKVVVTSRARLNLKNEALFPVEGLDFPTRLFQDPDLFPAVRLFHDRACLVKPDYQAKEVDWEVIEQICRRVQGMPLAVLLAAGWMGVLSPQEILREIETNSLDFLESNWQDIPERQHSMRIVFDGSYHLLSPREQEVFAGLSVFWGGFTLASARAVTGMTLRELRTLVDKCLVQRASAGRYTLHELLRQYAGEALRGLPEFREAIHDRHAAYFAVMLEGWWSDLQGPRQFTAIKELGVELENALAAWNWMAERIQVERMSQAVFGLLHGVLLIYSQLLGTETVRLLFQQAAEKLAPRVLPAPAAFEDATRLLTRLWITQPYLSWQFPDQAYTFVQSSETLLNQLAAAGQDIRLEKAMLLRRKGGLLSIQAGNVEEVRRLYGESLRLFRELGDDYRASGVLNIWGFNFGLLGLQSEGYQLLKESIAISQRLGDRIGMSDSLRNMRETIWLMLHGEFHEYERLVREYLASCQETGNPQLIASAQGELGAMLLRQGEFAEAYVELAESFATLDQLGVVAESYFYGLYLSEAQIHLGQLEEADARCRMILPYYRKNNQFTVMGYNLLLLGWAALGMEKHAEARQYLEEAAKVEPELRINDRNACISSLSYAERGLSQPAQAVSNLIQAMTIAIQTSMVPIYYFALPAAALLLVDQGKIEQALEIYALASRFSYVRNSRWFEAVAGREIAARAANLPAEVVAAALARSKSSDLMRTADELIAELQKIAPVG